MRNYITKKLFASALLFLFSILISSCGIWTDFTTYFNTYYNARTLFDETEEQILEQNKDPFLFREENQQTTQRNIPQQAVQRTVTTQVVSQTTAGARTQTLSPQQIIQNLTKVIEKCSKILQFETESSYFDDALFMTGKSFYYQNEYARAQRKFIELAALPENEYELENKLWLAKTHLQLHSFDEGLKLIEEVKTTALEQEEQELFSSASITKIGFLVYRQEYQAAINECTGFLKSIDDDEMAGLVWYQMGMIYIKQGDEENALNAFTSVLEHSPSFEIEFESRLQHALILKDLKKMEESEEELNNLRDEGKFNNKMDRILIELGKIYYEKNDSEKAIEIFTEVDSTYKTSQTSGTASYWIGKIYERKFGLYDSAYKYYNKTVTSSAPYDIKVEAGNYVRNIDKYFNLANGIRDFRKSNIYLTTPTRFMQDSIDYDLAYKEYMTEVQRRVDSIKTKGNPNQISLTDQALEQQVQNQMQQEALQNINKRKPTDVVTLRDLIIRGKAKKPQRPVISADSLGTLLSRDYYNLANLFFSELDVPDSAYFYYSEILNNYPDKPSKVPALFALGTFYETKDQKEQADSLYQIIYDNYKQDPLFNEAAIKLGKVKKDEKKIVSNDPAEIDYIAAEELYFNNDYREALNGLTNVYLKYPKSSFATKALYFIGLIYEEKMNKYDSAAVYYGILSSKEYAATPYGKAVLAKYTEYKKEQERIEIEKQEKLREEENKAQELNGQTIEKPVSDSSAVQQKIPTGSKSVKRLIDDERVLPDTLKGKEERRKQVFDESVKLEQPLQKLITDSSTVQQKDTIDIKSKKRIIDDIPAKSDTLRDKVENKKPPTPEKIKPVMPDTTKKVPQIEK